MDSPHNILIQQSEGYKKFQRAREAILSGVPHTNTSATYTTKYEMMSAEELADLVSKAQAWLKKNPDHPLFSEKNHLFTKYILPVFEKNTHAQEVQTIKEALF